MLFNIFLLIIMFLAQALNSIKNYEANVDRQQVLAKSLKNPEKLAKTLLRIEFLTACRRHKLSSRFIDDSLRSVYKIFPNNQSVGKKCGRLATSLLNEAIAEAHRTRAYLLRERDRLGSATADFLTQDRLAELHNTCEYVFNATIHENRPRLVKKFQLRWQQAKSVHADADEDGEDVRSEKETSTMKKVNNLSSLDFDRPRLALLSKGPNFALTQNVSKTVLLEAEKGVERLAYAKRWKDALMRARLSSVTTSIRLPGTTDTHTRIPDAGPSSNSLTSPAPDSGTSKERIQTAAAAAATATASVTRAAGTVAEGTAAGTATTDTKAGRRRGPMDATAADTRAADRDSGSTAAAAAAEEQRRLTTAEPGSDRPGSSSGAAAAGAEPTTNRRSYTQSGLSFRFPDTNKRYPPPSNNDVELKLKKLKDEVVKTYINHKVVKSNVSDNERHFLRELKKNNEVVVKQSDKGKGFVILDRNTYLEKAQDILGDPSCYEKLDKNPVPKVEAQTKRTFKSVSKDKLPEKTIAELTPSHSRTPVFYGLPKDHKPSIPLRPVISGYDGPTEKTSCLLERILKQLLKFVPTHLWNTQDFLNKIRSDSDSDSDADSDQNKITEGTIFFSMDAVNLYGSIPVTEAIDAVTEKLTKHLQDVDTFGLTPADIKTLLEQCLFDNVFSFGDQHYRQKLGIAMGNPCAPPIAILFLDKLEQRSLEGITRKPKFLARYIDDYAGIWTHGEEALMEFLAYMNTVHETVKFTIEHSGGGTGVPFLDTLVTVEKQGTDTTIETELYIKPTNSGIMLHYDSAHPTQTKHNMARGQFIRAIRNSSNVSKEKKSIAKIWTLLLENGYPKHILARLLSEARRKARTPNRGGQKTGEGDSDGYLCLPYVDEQLLCKIKKKVRQSDLNIRVAWKNKEKLKTMLVRSSLGKPKCPGGQRCHTCSTGFTGDCTQKNLVYEITCVKCSRGGIYIGETKRPLRLRFNEHVRDAFNRTPDTPMGDHFRDVHNGEVVPGSTIPLRVKVLYKSRDHPDRKIAESLLIKRNRPDLNTNVSSWPTL